MSSGRSDDYKPKRAKSGGFRLCTEVKKGTKIKSDRLRVTCGCCENRVDIFYGNDDNFEINGVFASRGEWQRVFRKIKLIGVVSAQVRSKKLN